MSDQIHASADTSSGASTDPDDRIREIEILTNAPDTATVDTRQAAVFLGLCPETLEVWRSTRRNRIPFLKMGRAVRYLMGDLRKFQDECRVA